MAIALQPAAVGMARVAFMTFGVLHEPRTHRRSKGFVDLVPATYQAAERSEGFITRVSEEETDSGRGESGELAWPRFMPEGLRLHVARTLSLWDSLESVFAFSYAGPHVVALGCRKEWFRHTEYPSYVIWWVGDDHVPTFVEATARLEHLHIEGPGPEAFSFSCPFEWDGSPTALDHQLVNDIIERNTKVASIA